MSISSLYVEYLSLLCVKSASSQSIYLESSYLDLLESAKSKQRNRIYTLNMSQNNLLDPANIKREVSESGFEYLLGELLNLQGPANVNDKASAQSERLEAIGYDVGYR